MRSSILLLLIVVNPRGYFPDGLIPPTIPRVRRKYHWNAQTVDVDEPASERSLPNLG